MRYFHKDPVATVKPVRKFFYSVLLAFCSSGIAASQPRPLTDRDVALVLEAIEDEIYAHDYQGDFFHLRNTRHSALLPVYISPEIEQHGYGNIVYKLIPHGEVIRRFVIGEEGIAILLRDPESGFAPTQAEMLTLYLDDEVLIEIKTRWRRAHFTVLFKPPKERIRQAVERQKIRLAP